MFLRVETWGKFSFRVKLWTFFRLWPKKYSKEHEIYDKILAGPLTS